MKDKKHIALVDSITKISSDVFLFTLIASQLARAAQPGQFIHVKIPGVILRRPLSIHDIVGSKLYLLFRARGKGTQILANFKKGQTLDILGPLGSGFQLDRVSEKHAVNILIGGGIGVAPLLFLARCICKASKLKPVVLLGAKHAQDIFAARAFKKLGCRVFISTDDGSAGIKGNVVHLLNSVLKTDININIFACGPQVMFRAIHEVICGMANVRAQVSFEQFMGCGTGICCGCTVAVKDGYKKACKDGPVFDINDAF
jgi:dihydroorotate dehydrogenase electron transfer subunit